MTRKLMLDPQPAAALDTLWSRNERLADAVEEALDWIEADPPDVRSLRRRFTNGIWAVGVRAVGEDWTILWEEPEPGCPVARFIGETQSI
jgi:hypothetical protein